MAWLVHMTRLDASGRTTDDTMIARFEREPTITPHPREGEADEPNGKERKKMNGKAKEPWLPR